MRDDQPDYRQPVPVPIPRYIPEDHLPSPEQREVGKAAIEQILAEHNLTAKPAR